MSTMANGAESTVQLPPIGRNDTEIRTHQHSQSIDRTQDLIDVADAGVEASIFVRSAPPRWDAEKAKELPRHAYLEKQLKSGFSVASFDLNDPSSLTAYFITNAITKAHSAIWKRFVAGLLAGVFVCFGALFAISAAGGLDPAFRASYPAVPKLILGATFPLAIGMILIIGGDLFTGNCFFAGVALLSGRIGLGEFTNLLFVSFFSNLSGLLFCDYFLGYLTDLFGAEPWSSFVLSTANNKVALDWGVAVLRGIGANTMICVAIFMGCSAKDALGRYIISWGPVSLFAVTGFEHVIANMAFIPLALMYGGTNFSTGGTFLVGGFAAYLYAKRRQETFIEWVKYISIPDVTVNEWFAELFNQIFENRPIKEERK